MGPSQGDALRARVQGAVSQHLLSQPEEQTCGCGWTGPATAYPAHLAEKIVSSIDLAPAPSDPVDLRGFGDLVGISLQTLRTYRKDGRLPSPDGRIGKADWWYASTVHDWTQNRPGSSRPSR